jgi:hypothetical protein
MTVQLKDGEKKLRMLWKGAGKMTEMRLQPKTTSKANKIDRKIDRKRGREGGEDQVSGR